MDSRRPSTSDSDRISAHQTLSSAADVMGVDERGVDGMAAASPGTGTVGATFHRAPGRRSACGKVAAGNHPRDVPWTTRRPRRSVTAGPSLVYPRADLLHAHTATAVGSAAIIAGSRAICASA